jgi:hypothetical protein
MEYDKKIFQNIIMRVVSLEFCRWSMTVCTYVTLHIIHGG